MNNGILIIIAIVALLSFVEVLGIPYETTVDGSHTGVITAVETTGIIFKTVTVYVKTDEQSSQEDMYCLIDRSLVPTLKEYEQNKQQVTVYFNNFLIKGLKNCNGEQGGIITGVRTNGATNETI